MPPEGARDRGLPLATREQIEAADSMSSVTYSIRGRSWTPWLGWKGAGMVDQIAELL